MSDSSKLADREGYLKLSDAARHGRVEIVVSLVRQGYDPCTDFGLCGETYKPPLYQACRYGHLSLVKLLIEVCKCDPKYKTKRNGTTLLHVACTKGHFDIVRYLAKMHHLDPNVRNSAGTSMLHNACHYGHLKIVKFLIDELGCDPRSPGKKEGEAEGESLLHVTSSAGHLDIVAYLVTKHSLNPNAASNFGETPLHCACTNGRLEVVRYLIEEQGCSTSSVDSGGNSLLHLACQNGNQNVVQYLIECKYCDPNARDKYWNTPLHIACRYGRLEAVRVLLQTGIVDPSCTTLSGESPLQIAQDQSIMKALIRAGADTKGITHVQDHFQVDQPPESLVRVFVVGHPSSGKSTLVTALQPDHWVPRKFSIWKRYKEVTGVSPQTAGIIPVEFNSPDFGQVLFFDFAGHFEYYASHAVLLECSNTSSAPLFILVVNLEEDLKDTKQRISYWLSFLENHRIATSSKPHFVLVGSHKDTLKKNDPTGYRAKIFAVQHFAQEYVSSETSFHMVGFFPTDCRQPKKQMKLRRSLKQSCSNLRSNIKVDTICHNLRVFLLDNFPEEMTCTVRDVMELVKKSDEPIPCTAERLCELCNALNDKMGILFLKNQQELEKSWIVLNIEALLSRIYGCTFAPKGFQQHCLEASATGILRYSDIEREFTDLDPSLVVAFLSRLEFCQRISDPQILRLIRGNSPQPIPPRLISTSPHSSDSEDDVGSDGPRRHGRSRNASDPSLTRRPTISNSPATSTNSLPATNDSLFHPGFVNHRAVSSHPLQSSHSLSQQFPFQMSQFQFRMPLPQVQQPHYMCPPLHASPPHLQFPFSPPHEVQVHQTPHQALFQQNSFLHPQQYNPTFRQYTHEMPDSNEMQLYQYSTIPRSSHQPLHASPSPPQFQPSPPHMFRQPPCEVPCQHSTPSLNLPPPPPPPPPPPDDYLFFPGLISAERPGNSVWFHDDTFNYYSGWCLIRSQPNQFFSPRFLQILLLRLAFAFPMARPSPIPVPIRTTNGYSNYLSTPECTIWKNGLHWLNLDGVETIVEMIENATAIVVLMRVKQGAEMKCIQLRSGVIRKILEAKEEVCQNVVTQEYLIDPSELRKAHYPVITRSLNDLLLYEARVVVKALVERKKYVKSVNDNRLVELEDLLYFDAFMNLGEELLTELYYESDEKRDTELQDFLFRFSEHNCDKDSEFAQVLGIGKSRRSSPPPMGTTYYPPNPTKDVVMQWWEKSPDFSLTDFRTVLERFSLFSGRNILELFHYPHSHSFSNS